MEAQTPQQPAQPAGQSKKEGGSSSNKGMAYLAYIIFFIPLLTDAKNDEFVKYHVKQGLVLFLAWIGLSVINIIPILGQIIFLVGAIFLFVVWIMGLLNVSKDEKKPLPLIGKWGEKFKF
jgi:uncharacterized membrane protein